MADSNVLVETIAAAMLDGLTLSFSPIDTEGTALPTGVLVDAWYGNGAHRASAEIGFHELLLSGAADKVLSVAIGEATSTVVETAIDDVSVVAAR